MGGVRRHLRFYFERDRDPRLDCRIVGKQAYPKRSGAENCCSREPDREVGEDPGLWFVRAYGEGEYHELILRVAKQSRLSHALLPTIAAAAFTALIGLVLLLLSPDPSKDWGYWFGFGFLTYAFIIVFYGSLFYVRLFRKAKRDKPNAPVA